MYPKCRLLESICQLYRNLSDIPVRPWRTTISTSSRRYSSRLFRNSAKPSLWRKTKHNTVINLGVAVRGTVIPLFHLWDNFSAILQCLHWSAPYVYCKSVWWFWGTHNQSPKGGRNFSVLVGTLFDPNMTQTLKKCVFRIVRNGRNFGVKQAF